MAPYTYSRHQCNVPSSSKIQKKKEEPTEPEVIMHGYYPDTETHIFTFDYGYLQKENSLRGKMLGDHELRRRKNPRDIVYYLSRGVEGTKKPIDVEKINELWQKYTKNTEELLMMIDPRSERSTGRVTYHLVYDYPKDPDAIVSTEAPASPTGDFDEAPQPPKTIELTATTDINALFKSAMTCSRNPQSNKDLLELMSHPDPRFNKAFTESDIDTKYICFCQEKVLQWQKITKARKRRESRWGGWCSVTFQETVSRLRSRDWSESTMIAAQKTAELAKGSPLPTDPLYLCVPPRHEQMRTPIYFPSVSARQSGLLTPTPTKTHVGYARSQGTKYISTVLPSTSFSKEYNPNYLNSPNVQPPKSSWITPTPRSLPGPTEQRPFSAKLVISTFDPSKKRFVPDEEETVSAAKYIATQEVRKLTKNPTAKMDSDITRITTSEPETHSQVTSSREVVRTREKKYFPSSTADPRTDRNHVSNEGSTRRHFSNASSRSENPNKYQNNAEGEVNRKKMSALCDERKPFCDGTKRKGDESWSSREFKPMRRSEDNHERRNLMSKRRREPCEEEEPEVLKKGRRIKVEEQKKEDSSGKFSKSGKDFDGTLKIRLSPPPPLPILKPMNSSTGNKPTMIDVPIDAQSSEESHLGKTRVTLSWDKKKMSSERSNTKLKNVSASVATNGADYSEIPMDIDDSSDEFLESDVTLASKSEEKQSCRNRSPTFRLTPPPPQPDLSPMLKSTNSVSKPAEDVLMKMVETEIEEFLKKEQPLNICTSSSKAKEIKVDPLWLKHQQELYEETQRAIESILEPDESLDLQMTSFNSSTHTAVTREETDFGDNQWSNVFNLPVPPQQPILVPEKDKETDSSKSALQKETPKGCFSSPSVDTQQNFFNGYDKTENILGRLEHAPSKTFVDIDVTRETATSKMPDWSGDEFSEIDVTNLYSYNQALDDEILHEYFPSCEIPLTDAPLKSTSIVKTIRDEADQTELFVTQPESVTIKKSPEDKLCSLHNSTTQSPRSVLGSNNAIRDELQKRNFSKPQSKPARFELSEKFGEATSSSAVRQKRPVLEDRSCFLRDSKMKEAAHPGSALKSKSAVDTIRNGGPTYNFSEPQPKAARFELSEKRGQAMSSRDNIDLKVYTLLPWTVTKVRIVKTVCDAVYDENSRDPRLRSRTGVRARMETRKPLRIPLEPLEAECVGTSCDVAPSKSSSGKSRTFEMQSNASRSVSAQKLSLPEPELVKAAVAAPIYSEIIIKNAPKEASKKKRPNVIADVPELLVVSSNTEASEDPAALLHNQIVAEPPETIMKMAPEHRQTSVKTDKPQLSRTGVETSTSHEDIIAGGMREAMKLLEKFNREEAMKSGTPNPSSDEQVIAITPKNASKTSLATGKPQSSRLDVPCFSSSRQKLQDNAPRSSEQVVANAPREASNTLVTTGESQSSRLDVPGSSSSRQKLQNNTPRSSEQVVADAPREASNTLVTTGESQSSRLDVPGSSFTRQKLRDNAPRSSEQFVANAPREASNSSVTTGESQLSRLDVPGFFSSRQKLQDEAPRSSEQVVASAPKEASNTLVTTGDSQSSRFDVPGFSSSRQLFASAAESAPAMLVPHDQPELLRNNAPLYSSSERVVAKSPQAARKILVAVRRLKTSVGTGGTQQPKSDAPSTSSSRHAIANAPELAAEPLIVPDKTELLRNNAPACLPIGQVIANAPEPAPVALDVAEVAVEPVKPLVTKASSSKKRRVKKKKKKEWSPIDWSTYDMAAVEVSCTAPGDGEDAWMYDGHFVFEFPSNKTESKKEKTPEKSLQSNTM